MDETLQCWDFESDDDPPEHQCCGICHYGNLWDDDVRGTFTLKDGREAELCCGKIRKLVSINLLDEEHLKQAHPRS